VLYLLGHLLSLTFESSLYIQYTHFFGGFVLLLLLLLLLCFLSAQDQKQDLKLSQVLSCQPAAP
jgi:heme A synthase